jgi:hypothetical protein
MAITINTTMEMMKLSRSSESIASLVVELFLPFLTTADRDNHQQDNGNDESSPLWIDVGGIGSHPPRTDGRLPFIAFLLAPVGIVFVFRENIYCGALEKSCKKQTRLSITRKSRDGQYKSNALVVGQDCFDTSCCRN